MSCVPFFMGDNLRALVMIVFLSYRGVIEVDISEYHTASVLINYLDFNFILQGNIKLLNVDFICVEIMKLICRAF